MNACRDQTATDETSGR